MYSWASQRMLMASNKRTRGKHHRSGGGKREDLGGLYVRSSWEHNYILYLNWRKEHGQIVKWEYEPETFEFPVKRGNRSYLPDFKVFFPDGHYEWHEVKGYMDASSKTKLKRMAKYYPEEIVVLIDGPVYKDIARIFKKILPGWEQ